MPKIRTALFEQISGSLNDKYSFKTYHTNQNKIILERKPDIAPHETEKALKIKTYFKNASIAWKLLNNKAKQIFKQVADLLNITAYNLFLHYAINAQIQFPNFDLINALRQTTLFNYYRIGRLYNLNYCVGATGTQAMTANRLYAQPVLIAQKVRIDAVSIRVTTAQAGQCRTAIFNAGNDLYPSKKLIDGSVIDTGSTGDKISLLDITLEPGLYYLAWICSSAPTLGGTTAAYGLTPLGRTSVYVVANNTVYADIGSFTIPNNFPTNPTETNLPYLIAFRVAEVF